MSSDQGQTRAGNVLVADIENGRCLSVPAAPLAGFTERHRCDLLAGKSLEPTADLASRLATAPENDIALIVTTGIPGRRILAAAAESYAKGQRVYFYWPDEKAVEVGDRHRLASYRRHYAFFLLSWPPVRAYRAVKSFAIRAYHGQLRIIEIAHLRRVKKMSAALRQHLVLLKANNTDPTATDRLRRGARAILGEPPEADARLEGVKMIEGRGAYVRLDYWSKLKTGGSYGHTCFLAKSAAEATSDFECVFANKFELLDRFGIRQRLLAHRCPWRTSTDLIYFGDKFNGRVAAALDELRPAYVYERSVLGNVAAARWCAASGVPYIVEYNGSELAMARSFGRPYELESELEALEDYQFSVATVLNVISEPVAEGLVERGFERAKILVNPNAVDPDFYAPLAADEAKALRRTYGFNADDVVVGFCGTFGGWHGIDVLSAAMAPICAADPRIKFLLIGDGNLKGLITKAVAEHRLADRVVDLGLIPQAAGAKAMAVADILVAPHAQNIDGKTFYGSPTKLFEYMAVGAAVVSSDLAQLGEVMRPSLTVGELAGGPHITDQRGVLVKPGSVDEFVEAVTALVKQGDVRRALASNARKAVIENYTWDNHVRNIWRFMAGLPLKGYATDRVKGG